MKNLSLGLILGLFVFFTPSFAEVNTESIIQIFQRLETLEQKTRELHGENEVLSNQIEQLKKTQKQGFLNVDERIDELSNTIKSSSEAEASPAAKTDEKKVEPTVKVDDPKPTTSTTEEATAEKETAATKPTSPAAKAPPVKQAEKPVIAKPVESKAKETNTATKAASEATQTSTRAPSAYEKETYQAAFNKMGASPTAATNAFQEYIKMQPNSPLAANAQYWIGEIKYSHNNYKGAVDEFIVVLQKYKNSNKAPDAAIKLGYSFYALKNWPYARRTFEDVLKYFPKNENAVKLATQRLEKMKAAGN